MRRGDCAQFDLERALQEARLASHVASDHVVRIRDVAFCEQSGLPYIDMDPCGQLTAGRYTHARSMSETPALDQAEVVRWLIDAAHGVHAAHKCGVFHCDLKPQNILIAPNRRALVTDFGLSVRAREATGAGALPAAPTLLGGTPAYMAPEQIEYLLQGEHETSGTADTAGAHERWVRADVYALGAVLYHMLAGRPPYRALDAASDRVLDVLSQIRAGDLPPSLELLTREARARPLPPALVRIVERAMAWHPAQRYSSAAEFADALGTHLARGLRREARPGLRHRWLARADARLALGCASACWILLGNVAGAGRLDVALQLDAQPNALNTAPVPLPPNTLVATGVSPVIVTAAGSRPASDARTQRSRSPGRQTARQPRAAPDVSPQLVRGITPPRATSPGPASPHPPNPSTIAPTRLPASAAQSPPASADAAVTRMLTPTPLPNSAAQRPAAPRSDVEQAQRLFVFVRQALSQQERLITVEFTPSGAHAYCLLDRGGSTTRSCMRDDLLPAEIQSSLAKAHKSADVVREWTADRKGRVIEACETEIPLGSYLRRTTCQKPPAAPLRVVLPPAQDRDGWQLATMRATP